MDKIFIDEAVNDLHTIQDMLRWAISCFSVANIWYGHGTDNPWDEAIQLILPTLWLPIDIPKHMMYARLTISERNRIVKRVIRRVNERIPVAYITNKAWFCGHEFYVDQRVLIPRSLIGELIRNRFTSLIHEQPHHILDMCTGSGCIAIACAYAFPEAKIEAIDISIHALEVAEKNVIQHGLSNRVALICADLFRGLASKTYDLIIANPPYVNAKDLDDLPDEYQHEPTLGLTAGSNGLKFIYRILARVSDYLSEQGILICEVGNNMVHIIEKYPDVPFIWLDFDNGGDGVFMLMRKEIIEVQHYFYFYKD